MNSKCSLLSQTERRLAAPIRQSVLNFVCFEFSLGKSLLPPLLLAVYAASQASDNPAGALPNQPVGGLAFDKDVFSYKADPSDTQFTATFRLRNDGEKPVKIKKLGSSCSCMSVGADRNELASRDECIITAVFNIPKHSGESEKTITVETDDPVVPVKHLTVKVTVPPIVEITPAITEWKVGEQCQPREIVVKVLQKQPIRILEATSSRRQVTVTTKSIVEGREYRLILTPSSTDEKILGFVSIKTDCEISGLQHQMSYFKIE